MSPPALSAARECLCPEERRLLAQLREQARGFLAGQRAPSGAWLLANYLDLAQVRAAERRTAVWRGARQWLAQWAQQAENAGELERLAARSWTLRHWHEQQLAASEVAADALLRAQLARRKRPFLNARDEMAFVERVSTRATRRRPANAGEPPARRYGT